MVLFVFETWVVYRMTKDGLVVSVRGGAIKPGGATSQVSGQRKIPFCTRLGFKYHTLGSEK